MHLLALFGLCCPESFEEKYVINLKVLGVNAQCYSSPISGDCPWLQNGGGGGERERRQGVWVSRPLRQGNPANLISNSDSTLTFVSLPVLCNFLVPPSLQQKDVFSLRKIPKKINFHYGGSERKAGADIRVCAVKSLGFTPLRGLV